MKNVQDIYPVSPMQEFMLLHALSNSASDTLFNQFVFSVRASIDPEKFAHAWSQVVASHPALRTAFIWQGVEKPQQVVRQTVKINCQTLDFTQFAQEKRQTELDSTLRDDRKEGFDFRRAPLMRFKLIQLEPDNWRVVWSSHHLILDRWCIDVLISDFQRHYAAAVSGSAVDVARAPSYREYIAWIAQQDRNVAIAYWRRYLDGFTVPTVTSDLVASSALKDAERHSSAYCSLGTELTGRARKFGGAASVTLGCVIQAAIALAFNRLLERPDVVFGVTVAGRPAAIARVEDIAGSFINTVPVRTKFESSVTLGDWLRALNGAQFASAEFDYLSPAQLRTCASLDSDRPLFDVLVVWLAQTRLETRPNGEHAELPLVAASEQFATAYPLTLSIIEKTDELVLRADTAGGRALPLQALLDRIKESVSQLLDAVPEDALEQLGSVALMNDIEQISQPTDVHEVNDLFEFARSAGVANVAGREAARVDLIEDLLKGEWKEVLGTDRTIDVEDDFFELGGDSLRAVALHTRIESATRKAIPLLALFERSTLAGMARTLVDEKWPLRAGLAMPLRVNDSRPPLFCVASPEVNTIGYAMLTRHLSESHNVVLLQAPPDSEDLQQLHPDDLASMAAKYIDAMKKIQPGEPYSLLSMCSGSHIAHHMVQQLERAGDNVQFMGVINTWSLYSVSRSFYLNRFLNVVDYYVQRVKQVLGSSRAPEAAIAVAAPHEPEPPQMLPADSAVGLDNPWIRQVGLAHKMPSGLKTRVTISVFRLARQPFWRTGERELGWKRLAGSARSIDLPGDDHDSILREPHVSNIAQALETELEQAKSRLAAGASRS